MSTSLLGQPSPDLQQLVAESDSGGRKVGGFVGKLIFAIAVGWSLFQLWYASPLPFMLGWGVLNDTEARSLHLGNLAVLHRVSGSGEARHETAGAAKRARRRPRRARAA